MSPNIGKYGDWSFINYLGQGYALKSYQPEVLPRKKPFVEWSCAPVLKLSDPAVAEIQQKAQKDRAMFPFPIEADLGAKSWNCRKTTLSRPPSVSTTTVPSP